MADIIESADSLCEMIRSYLRCETSEALDGIQMDLDDIKTWIKKEREARDAEDIAREQAGSSPASP